MNWEYNTTSRNSYQYVPVLFVSRPLRMPQKYWSFTWVCGYLLSAANNINHLGMEGKIMWQFCGGRIETNTKKSNNTIFILSFFFYIAMTFIIDLAMMSKKQFTSRLYRNKASFATNSSPDVCNEATDI